MLSHHMSYIQCSPNSGNELLATVIGTILKTTRRIPGSFDEADMSSSSYGPRPACRVPAKSKKQHVTSFGLRVPQTVIP